ncbi:MAG: trimethylamine methyltransferase family protein, partial [Actinomycetota bacterium]|nr:trimethylamine methyltransferase family protein [Actinomycetota bacterium]
MKSDEIKEIFNASMDILEKTGVKVFSTEAVEIFKKNGCIIKDDNIVHIPNSLVKSTLNSIPERITIYNRISEPAMIMEDGIIHYGTGSDCPNFIDPYTQERRPSTSQDVINSAIVSDHLNEIDFHMSLSRASEKSPENHLIHQYALMLKNTIKPLIVTAKNKNNLEKIYSIAALISGSKEDFKLKPNFILYLEPSSPLMHSKDVLEKLIFSVENDIPLIYAPCPMAGATSPVTKAGTLVIALCDSLSGIVLTQLIKPGAQVFMGGVISNLDMSTLIMPGASPEFLSMSVALTEISRNLKIPMFSTAGCTDAKTVDEQAAIEVTDSIIFAGLSGANIIHDLGFLQSSLTGCLELVVMSNEIIRKMKKVFEGIKVNEATLMRDVINKVGPGGNYLLEDSTVRLFKKEFFFPKLFNRDNYENWLKKGSKPLKDRLNEEVLFILENHKTEKIESIVNNKIN